ncbi:MAG TPA: alkaline phosphatase, partial [Dongiaceae bacterium]
MTQAIDNTRRQTLKILAGAPLLPLAGSFAAGSALFPSLAQAAAAPAIAAANFMSMVAPGLDNAPAMATTTVGSSLAVKYADGTQQNFKLAYEPFF